MKFDYIPKDKLPSNILLCRGLYKCSVCGEITSYVEINYEGYFCSEECLEKFDKKYFVSFQDRNDKNAQHLLITNYQLQVL